MEMIFTWSHRQNYGQSNKISLTLWDVDICEMSLYQYSTQWEEVKRHRPPLITICDKLSRSPLKLKVSFSSEGETCAVDSEFLHSTLQQTAQNQETKRSGMMKAAEPRLCRRLTLLPDTFPGSLKICRKNDWCFRSFKQSWPGNRRATPAVSSCSSHVSILLRHRWPLDPQYQPQAAGEGSVEQDRIKSVRQL